jgi:hypothetical protein
MKVEINHEVTESLEEGKCNNLIANSLSTKALFLISYASR